MVYPKLDKINQPQPPINHVENDTDFFNIPTAGGSECTGTMLMYPIVYAPDA
jgi:hypothetical protein